VFLCPPIEGRARPRLQAVLSGRPQGLSARLPLDGISPEISGPHRHLICGCRRAAMQLSRRASLVSSLLSGERIPNRKGTVSGYEPKSALTLRISRAGVHLGG
jgi:hypothetical protein